MGVVRWGMEGKIGAGAGARRRRTRAAAPRPAARGRRPEAGGPTGPGQARWWPRAVEAMPRVLTSVTSTLLAMAVRPSACSSPLAALRKMSRNSRKEILPSLSSSTSLIMALSATCVWRRKGGRSEGILWLGRGAYGERK